MFCGEAIGEAAPPILEARAIPRMRALEKRDSEGRLRSKGWSRVSCFTNLGTIKRGVLG